MMSCFEFGYACVRCLNSEGVGWSVAFAFQRVLVVMALLANEFRIRMRS